MTATRHTFSGYIAEVRTWLRADGKASAAIYTVHEGSQLLQPYADVGPEIVANTEHEARAAALHVLRSRFGKEAGLPARVPVDSGFRVIERARSA